MSHNSNKKRQSPTLCGNNVGARLSHSRSWDYQESVNFKYWWLVYITLEKQISFYLSNKYFWWAHPSVLLFHFHSTLLEFVKSYSNVALFFPSCVALGIRLSPKEVYPFLANFFLNLIPHLTLSLKILIWKFDLPHFLLLPQLGLIDQRFREIQI